MTDHPFERRTIDVPPERMPGALEALKPKAAPPRRKAGMSMQEWAQIAADAIREAPGAWVRILEQVKEDYRARGYRCNLAVWQLKELADMHDELERLRGSCGHNE